jgi:hypothetical protein
MIEDKLWGRKRAKGESHHGLMENSSESSDSLPQCMSVILMITESLMGLKWSTVESGIDMGLDILNFQVPTYLPFVSIYVHTA